MKYLLIASASFALGLSAAHAAPQFGAAPQFRTASSSSSLSSGAAGADEAVPVLAWLRGQVIARLKGDAAAPAAKGKRAPTPADSEIECDEAKKAKEEKQAQAKAGLQAGPEPVYLAF